jgi:hypothetical protein
VVEVNLRQIPVVVMPSS